MYSKQQVERFCAEGMKIFKNQITITRWKWKLNSLKTRYPSNHQKNVVWHQTCVFLSS